MVVRGQFLPHAHGDAGKVVDEGTKDYAIVVSLNPELDIPCYGVRNKTTFVDEALVDELATARGLLTHLQHELDEAPAVAGRVQ